MVQVIVSLFLSCKTKVSGVGKTVQDLDHIQTELLTALSCSNWAFDSISGNTISILRPKEIEFRIHDGNVYFTL